MFGYRIPTRVLIAPGCFARLPEVAAGLELRGVLLVIDPGIRSTAWPEAARRGLHRAGVRTEVFAEVEANPRTETAARAAERIREEGLDGVVALGGGSVLDAAKAAAMLATNPGPPESFEGRDRYGHRPLPMIAVPTTCGTGSEVTWVAVLSHVASKTKISVKGETMFPTQALVDADLLKTLPPHLVAWTGMDALTHALEATTGTARNPVSDALAEKAIALLMRYLPRAAGDVAGDAEAREAVMRASTLAGLAFGNADVAGVHCLSESIGGLFDVPHGLANAILLAPVLRYHFDHVAPRLAELDGGDGAAGERAERFLAAVETLGRRLEIPGWASLGVESDDYPLIAENAERNGSNRSNPQPMTAARYLEILSALD